MPFTVLRLLKGLLTVRVPQGVCSRNPSSAFYHPMRLGIRRCRRHVPSNSFNDFHSSPLTKRANDLFWVQAASLRVQEVLPSLPAHTHSGPGGPSSPLGGTSAGGSPSCLPLPGSFIPSLPAPQFCCCDHTGCPGASVIKQKMEHFTGFRQWV